MNLLRLTGSIPIGYIKAISEAEYILVPRTEMKPRTEILILPRQIEAIADDIGEERIRQLTGRFSIDRIDQGTSFQDGILPVEVEGDGHRVIPEFQDQRELR